MTAKKLVATNINIAGISQLKPNEDSGSFDINFINGSMLNILPKVSIKLIIKVTIAVILNGAVDAILFCNKAVTIISVMRG